LEELQAAALEIYQEVEEGAIRQKGESFAPEGHPQARERGGGSPEGDQPPRRKYPLVEKKEDTVRRETMINGAMISTLMG
jgi:hypothetical protein